jgi:hypothetical protein
VLCCAVCQPPLPEPLVCLLPSLQPFSSMTYIEFQSASIYGTDIIGVLITKTSFSGAAAGNKCPQPISPMPAPQRCVEPEGPACTIAFCLLGAARQLARAVSVAAVTLRVGCIVHAAPHAAAYAFLLLHTGEAAELGVERCLWDEWFAALPAAVFKHRLPIDAVGLPCSCALPLQ